LIFDAIFFEADMNIKKLSKSEWKKVVESIIKTGQAVYGVQARGERFAFAPLKHAGDLRLDYDVTILPPKKYFQPQCEVIATFNNESGYESVFDGRDFTVIGVHPYDMIAINQMDMLFSQDESDEHYLKRRRAATIIAVDVVKPSKNVFAASMETAVVREGYDMLLTDIGDGYVAQPATERGEHLLHVAPHAADASRDDLKKREAVWNANRRELNKHLLACKPGEIPALLDGAYLHPVWEEKAATCFSCGTCNNVCPTCYCFDVQDDVAWSLESGERKRIWDGCLLRAFTKVTGDHVFRKTAAQRFRHRLYRKGKYVPGKIGGQIACVGCGRCVGGCVPDIANPVAVYNRILADKK
jgi:ferredoxin